MRALLSSQALLETIYLVAALLFILSLKWLSSPASARRGVRAGEIGMLLAVVGTLLHHGIVDYTWIAIALVLGTVIGVPLGFVHMTAVPQRTALSHAFGALCVTLVGTAEFYLRAPAVPKFMGVMFFYSVKYAPSDFVTAAQRIHENGSMLKHYPLRDNSLSNWKTRERPKYRLREVKLLANGAGLARRCGSEKLFMTRSPEISPSLVAASRRKVQRR